VLGGAWCGDGGEWSCGGELACGGAWSCGGELVLGGAWSCGGELACGEWCDGEMLSYQQFGASQFCDGESPNPYGLRGCVQYSYAWSFGGELFCVVPGSCVGLFYVGPYSFFLQFVFERH
jgi:hypothetical protein